MVKSTKKSALKATTEEVNAMLVAISRGLTWSVYNYHNNPKLYAKELVKDIHSKKELSKISLILDADASGHKNPTRPAHLNKILHDKLKAPAAGMSRLDSPSEKYVVNSVMTEIAKSLYEVGIYQNTSKAKPVKKWGRPSRKADAKMPGRNSQYATSEGFERIFALWQDPKIRTQIIQALKNDGILRQWLRFEWTACYYAALEDEEAAVLISKATGTMDEQFLDKVKQLKQVKEQLILIGRTEEEVQNLLDAAIKRLAEPQDIDALAVVIPLYLLAVPLGD